MKAVVLRNAGSGAVVAAMLVFAHPAAAEGLRFGNGIERRAVQTDLREDLKGERRAGRGEDWRGPPADGLEPGRRAGRLDARYDTETSAGARRLSAEERRQLRRELQDAARDLYGR